MHCITSLLLFHKGTKHLLVFHPLSFLFRISLSFFCLLPAYTFYILRSFTNSGWFSIRADVRLLLGYPACHYFSSAEQLFPIEKKRKFCKKASVDIFKKYIIALKDIFNYNFLKKHEIIVIILYRRVTLYLA